MVEQKLRNDVQASDQALAQEIAVQTDLQLLDAENALVRLGKLAEQTVLRPHSEHLPYFQGRSQ